MDNVTIQDLISLSYDQKPIEFQQAFNSLVIDRVANSISNKKIEIAQSMFSDQPASEDYDESELNQEDNADVETT